MADLVLAKMNNPSAAMKMDGTGADGSSGDRCVTVAAPKVWGARATASEARNLSVPDRPCGTTLDPESAVCPMILLSEVLTRLSRLYTMWYRRSSSRSCLRRSGGVRDR